MRGSVGGGSKGEGTFPWIPHILVAHPYPHFQQNKQTGIQSVASRTAEPFFGTASPNVNPYAINVNVTIPSGVPLGLVHQLLQGMEHLQVPFCNLPPDGVLMRGRASAIVTFAKRRERTRKSRPRREGFVCFRPYGWPWFSE